MLCSYIISSYQLGLFLAKLGLHLGIIERLALTMVTMLGNLVIPMRGGSGAMAMYLKAAHKFNFGSFAVIYGGTALLVSLINSSLALGVLLYLAFAGDYYHPVLLSLSAFLFIGSAYLIFGAPPVVSRCHGILGTLATISKSWRLITKDKTLVTSLVVSTGFIVLSVLLAFWFIYRATSSNISFLGILVTTSIGNIANLVPFTPGSLGIFDAAVIQIPVMFDLDIARSMAAALIFRTLCFIWALLFGVPAAFYMARKVNTIHKDRW